jgi:curli biogenesis system outer membrane secretion channel CsgG
MLKKLVILLILFYGCLQLLPKQVYAQAEFEMEIEKTPPAELQKGNRARIAVAKFSVKAPKYKTIDPEGEAMKDMIITALYKTGKFLVLEREILEELEHERGLGEVEAEYESADIMIVGAVTGFEPHAAGKEISGFLCLPFLFAGGGMAEEEAYVAVDIRVVDTRTRSILGASRIEGRPGKKAYGMAGFGWASAFAAGGSFAGYKNTPIEEAMYDMLDNLITYLVNLIPQRYYKY